MVNVDMSAEVAWSLYSQCLDYWRWPRQLAAALGLLQASLYLIGSVVLECALIRTRNLLCGSVLQPGSARQPLPYDANCANRGLPYKLCSAVKCSVLGRMYWLEWPGALTLTRHVARRIRHCCYTGVHIDHAFKVQLSV